MPVPPGRVAARRIPESGLVFDHSVLNPHPVAPAVNAELPVAQSPPADWIFLERYPQSGWFVGPGTLPPGQCSCESAVNANVADTPPTDQPLAAPIPPDCGLAVPLLPLADAPSPLCPVTGRVDAHP